MRPPDRAGMKRRLPVRRRAGTNDEGVTDVEKGLGGTADRGDRHDRDCSGCPGSPTPADRARGRRSPGLASTAPTPMRSGSRAPLTACCTWPGRGTRTASTTATCCTARSAPTATTVSAPDTILPGVDLNNSVDLLPGPGGGLRVFFAGLMDPPSNPLSGLLATATAAADGKTWAIQPTPVSDPTDLGKHPVYAASGIGGGLFADGTPIGAWGDSAPAGGGYHVGLSSATPDFEFPEAAGDLGPDAATGTDGQLVLARNDIASEPSRLVATLLPSGQELVAPDSEAIQFNDRVSISGTIGRPARHLPRLHLRREPVRRLPDDLEGRRRNGDPGFEQARRRVDEALAGPRRRLLDDVDARRLRRTQVGRTPSSPPGASR